MYRALYLNTYQRFDANYFDNLSLSLDSCKEWYEYTTNKTWPFEDIILTVKPVKRYLLLHSRVVQRQVPIPQNLKRACYLQSSKSFCEYYSITEAPVAHKNLKTYSKYDQLAQVMASGLWCSVQTSSKIRIMDTTNMTMITEVEAKQFVSHHFEHDVNRQLKFLKANPKVQHAAVFVLAIIMHTKTIANHVQIVEIVTFKEPETSMWVTKQSILFTYDSPCNMVFGTNMFVDACNNSLLWLDGSSLIWLNYDTNEKLSMPMPVGMFDKYSVTCVAKHCYELRSAINNGTNLKREFIYIDPTSSTLASVTMSTHTLAFPIANFISVAPSGRYFVVEGRTNFLLFDMLGAFAAPYIPPTMAISPAEYVHDLSRVDDVCMFYESQQMNYLYHGAKDWNKIGFHTIPYQSVKLLDQQYFYARNIYNMFINFKIATNNNAIVLVLARKK